MNARSSVAALLLITATMQARGAVHLHPAAETSLQELREQLSRIHRLHDVDLVQLEAVLHDAQTHIDPDERQIAVLEKRLDDARAQEKALCQDLLKRTIEAYGIRPDRYSAPIVLEGAMGLRANWQPKFGKMDHAHTATLPNGDTVPMEMKDSYGGITWNDGTMIITYDAFMKSPGYLASIIAHETVHYEQITTRGRADQMTLAEREMEAYNFQLSAKNADTIFHLSDEEKYAINAARDRALKRSDASPFGSVRGGSEFSSEEALEPLHDGAESQFFSAMKELPDMPAAEFKAFQDGKRKEFSRQDEEQDRHDRLEYFRLLVHAACGDCDYFDQWVQQHPGISFRYADLDFSTSRPYNDFCEMKMWQNAAWSVTGGGASDRPTAMTPDYIGAWVRAYRVEQASHVAPHGDDSGRDSAGEREPSSRSDSDHQHVPGSVRGPAIGQLRGGHF